MAGGSSLGSDIEIELGTRGSGPGVCVSAAAVSFVSAAAAGGAMSCGSVCAGDVGSYSSAEGTAGAADEMPGGMEVGAAAVSEA